MFKINSIFVFCILISVFRSISAQCNYYQSVSAGVSYQIFSPRYPSKYQAGLSCSWQALVPIGYNAEISCTDVSIPYSTGCAVDSLNVSLTGATTPGADTVYCGNGEFVARSKGRAITVRLKTNTNMGYFFCSLKAVEDPCQCGRQNLARIVKGTETGINEFISMARLEDTLINFLLCGGAIISENYVLTAAHCVVNKKPSQVRLKVGEHDTSTASETPYTAIYAVASLIIHSDYNPTTSKNDIALVRPEKPIILNEGVGLICLPLRFRNQTFQGISVEAPGWGTLSFTGPLPKVLMKVTLDVISNQQCKLNYTSIDETQLCTYTEGKDTCQYDSGGSLIFNYGLLYTIGITSYGTGCAGPKPSVSTRVTYFLDWIQLKSPGVAYCTL